ncbi:MAG: carbohydrate-binding family 9-like protein [Thermoguttaceae bacterium]
MAKTYEAIYVPDARITVDGILDETVWQKANLETGFAFPWEDRPAPPTEFRAVLDRDALCFAFRVADPDVVLAADYRGKEDVVREDRAELFFARDDGLSDYFCLEIDPLGRVLDYRASYYRKMDFGWSWPGLEAAGRLVEGGYCVEGRIPWKSLESLGLCPTNLKDREVFHEDSRPTGTDHFSPSGSPLRQAALPPGSQGQIKFGIYRAEFRHTGGGNWAESWISWVDPQTPEPDFHVPGSFGTLRWSR